MHYSDRQLAQLRVRLGENIPVPPAPKKRSNEESRMQGALIKWWHHAHAGFGVPEILLFAVPNGAKRDAIVGSILKREGVRRGTSDLLLMVQRGRYGALAVEMKKPGGKPTPEQLEFLAECRRQSYAAFVCDSLDGAIRLITDYLTAPEKLF